MNWDDVQRQILAHEPRSFDLDEFQRSVLAQGNERSKLYAQLDRAEKNVRESVDPAQFVGAKLESNDLYARIARSSAESDSFIDNHYPEPLPDNVVEMPRRGLPKTIRRLAAIALAGVALGSCSTAGIDAKFANESVYSEPPAKAATLYHGRAGVHTPGVFYR